MSPLVLVLAAALLFIGLFGIFALALGAKFDADEKRGRGRLAKRLHGYGYAPETEQAINAPLPNTVLGNNDVARRAVGVADSIVLKRGFDESLTNSLASADIPLKPGEWMLIHAGLTLGTGIVFLLLSDLSFIAAIVGIAIGFAAPYLFLSIKRQKRRNAFYRALPDTLTMIAGSLKSGYSLPQAIDAVVQESTGPMADELGRALVEARLGTQIEDALDEIAVRMQSTDMSWVVMAIRIQREVGGNLAEVLLTVSATLRGRERLRRQVSVLSAEGRLSAIVLGALPVLFTAYLAIFQPDYLTPLFTTPFGWVMIIVGGGIFVAGVFWMSKVVKVEV